MKQKTWLSRRDSGVKINSPAILVMPCSFLLSRLWVQIPHYLVGTDYYYTQYNKLLI